MALNPRSCRYPADLCVICRTTMFFFLTEPSFLKDTFFC